MSIRNDHVRRVSHLPDGIDVSSVRGYVYGMKVDETCIFLPPTLATIRGHESEVVGTYDDHDTVVATLRFAMFDTTSVTLCDGDR